MEKTKSIDILDLLLILSKYKKFILLTVLIVSILAVVYVLVVPKYWISTTTILPADNKSSGLSFDSSSLLGLGSSLLNSNSQTNSLELVTIMSSNTFINDIINHFNLINYFEIEDPDTLVVSELALLAFREEVKSYSISEETGLVIVSIETKDKYLSMEIANYIVHKLDEFNQKQRNSSGRQQREFIEKRLVQIDDEREDLLNKLNKFQKENNIIELEQQTLMLVQMYSNLLSKKMELDIKLEYALNTLPKDSPQIDLLKKESEVIDSKIKNMELNVDVIDSKYVLHFNDISQLGIEYTNLKLNIEVLEQVYKFLYPQLEQAKLQEVKDIPTLTIIDKAFPAGLRSKPKRARFCIIAFILALFVTSIIAIFHHKLSHPDYKEKMREIKLELFKR